jgi:hypothetical protein
MIAIDAELFKIKINAAASWEASIVIDLSDRAPITLYKRFVTRLAPQAGMVIDGALIKTVALTEESGVQAIVTCEISESARDKTEIAKLAKAGWDAHDDESKAYVSLQVRRHS